MNGQLTKIKNSCFIGIGIIIFIISIAFSIFLFKNNLPDMIKWLLVFIFLVAFFSYTLFVIFKLIGLEKIKDSWKRKGRKWRFRFGILAISSSAIVALGCSALIEMIIGLEPFFDNQYSLIEGIAYCIILHMLSLISFLFNLKWLKSLWIKNDAKRRNNL